MSGYGRVGVFVGGPYDGDRVKWSIGPVPVVDPDATFNNGGIPVTVDIEPLWSEENQRWELHWPT